MSKTMEDAMQDATVGTVSTFGPATTNPVDFLSERQKIALAGRWAGLKDAERDELAEYVTAGITDSATLYAIRLIKDSADTKIFSESRPVYLGTLLQWYLSLVSNEEPIRKFAENELSKLANVTNGTQQMTLLSALKARLLDKRTYLPELQEKAFRATCRFFSIDAGMVK